MYELLPQLPVPLFLIFHGKDRSGTVIPVHPVPGKCVGYAADGGKPYRAHAHPPVIINCFREWRTMFQQFFFEHTGMSVYGTAEYQLMRFGYHRIADTGSRSAGSEVVVIKIPR